MSQTTGERSAATGKELRGNGKTEVKCNTSQKVIKYYQTAVDIPYILFMRFTPSGTKPH